MMSRRATVDVFQMIKQHTWAFYYVATYIPCSHSGIFPFFTGKSPHCERLFEDAPLRTLERAESPLLRLLMRDSFEERRCHVPVCAQLCSTERNADWCGCFLSVMRDPRREGCFLARVECESVWILWISCRCAPWLSERPIILAARRSLPPLRCLTLPPSPPRLLVSTPNGPTAQPSTVCPSLLRRSSASISLMSLHQSCYE